MHANADPIVVGPYGGRSQQSRRREIPEREHRPLCGGAVVGRLLTRAAPISYQGRLLTRAAPIGAATVRERSAEVFTPPMNGRMATAPGRMCFPAPSRRESGPGADERSDIRHRVPVPFLLPPA